MLPIGLLLEGLVAVLLAMTVVYCFILDRRLRQLRSGQDGMKEVISGLNSATERAQGSVAQLKIAGDAAGGELREAVTKARALSDELSVMIEAGNNIADRLAGGATKPKQSEPASEESLGTKPAREVNETEDVSTFSEDALQTVQSDFLKALREAR